MNKKQSTILQSYKILITSVVKVFQFIRFILTIKNNFRNGSNRDCNGKSTLPLQRLITLSWLYFTTKNSFCNGYNGDYNGKSTVRLQMTNCRCNGESTVPLKANATVI